METDENNQINYWGGKGTYKYDYQTPKKSKRSIKRKLFIVFSFIFVLAVTPSIIYALMNLNFSKGREVSVASTQIQAPTQPEPSEPEVHKVYIEEPKTAENETIVEANDNYWKITKRVCGQGNNYLFVKDANGGKALYEGDTVTVDCSL